MKTKLFFAAIAFGITGLVVPTSANGYWNEYYIPFVGISYINDHPDPNYDIRFTNQDFFWKAHGLQAYNYWNDTYEHETVFYDYDGDAFAREYVSSNWWASTMPDPYLDTQALDNPNEPNIAVGSFDPTDFVPDTYYNSYVALEETNSSGSFYKIQGQKGYSYCEAGPWCVLQQQDTTKMIPFASPFEAPEYRTFRYEWENNDGQGVADRITLGQWASGVINYNNDADWWVFNVPTSQTVDMEVKLGGIPAPNNYDIEIYKNTNGTWSWVAGSYNGIGNDENITKYLTAGDYYAKVYPAAGSDDHNTYHFLAY